jgi:ankyrin repeat protein
MMHDSHHSMVFNHLWSLDFAAIVKRILETRPGLAREEGKDRCTPIMLGVLWNTSDVVKVFLEHDRSLGYEVSNYPLLVSAAFRGHVEVARELLKHCPDAPYCQANGWTCLHEAVWRGRDDFLEFILEESQHHLRKLINMRCRDGKTALQYAVEKCRPRMVRALLRHKDIDVTAVDNIGHDANSALFTAKDHAKTLSWVRMFRYSAPLPSIMLVD